ncbi:MAG: hypothetical protein ACR2LE_04045 [Nocardioidaceae bacterium]
MPHPAGSGSPRAGAAALRTALGLSALLSLGYAVWALTARRGVFSGFRGGDPANVEDARSNDHIDTTFFLVAAALAVVALTWWLVRVAADRSPRSGVTVAGMALCALGAAVALAGLILSAGVSDGADVADEGGKGVTAAIVLGGGFVLLAVGLALGSLVAGRRQPAAEWPAAPVGRAW